MTLVTEYRGILKYQNLKWKTIINDSFLDHQKPSHLEKMTLYLL